MNKKMNIFDRILDEIYGLMQKLLKYTDNQESFDKIHERIIRGSKIDGVNVIILFCAAMIASVGLHQDSTAIIIGAMLISPLMGPILAIGYGLAIFDRLVIISGFKNLAKSIIISLISSVVFFFFANLDSPTDEILARTSPSVFDILVAFVGGIAGIIAITRTEKTNVIPGVAIATALMPPLCTVGYGIANMDISIILGASYLFFINIFFIILSTFIIVKAIGMCYEDSESYIVAKRRRHYVTVAVILVCLPSLFSAYNIYVSNSISSSVEQIGRDINESNDKYVYYEIDSEQKNVDIYYYGEDLTDSEIDKYNQYFKENTLVKYSLQFNKMTDSQVLNYLID